jgi:molybdate transport system substrate-binding protein
MRLLVFFFDNFKKSDWRGARVIRTCHAAMVLAAISSLSLIAGGRANAAEIRLLHPGVLTGVVKALVPQFEKSSGHKVTTAAGTGGALTERIEKGEAADVLIVTAGQIKQLAAKGKIIAGTQTNIARLEMGIAVRKGALKPDINSVDSLRRALLAAKTVGYPDPAQGAPSGIHAAKVIAELGLAEELKSKTRMFSSGPELVTALAKGDVELGFAQMTEVAAEPGVILAGALPAPHQNTTQLAGGVVAASQQIDAANALLGFLISPTARSALVARGFE